MNDLIYKDIFELSLLLKSKQISSVELTTSYLKSIKNQDEKICAYLTVCTDLALENAKKSDETIQNSEIFSPLTGIPYALKDNICTKGIKTTCASKMLENFVPPYDATVFEILKNKNSVLLGKVNMDEFAMGSSGENSAFKSIKNPNDLTCVAGGSSGGSAAAVAANEAAFSLGSDTGGSIRQPAAFCGVVGMKPTYGRVSRFGLVAFASSLDQIGPITKNVYDNALVLNEISKYDKKDATSANKSEIDFTKDIKNGVKGMKIGIIRDFHKNGIQEEIKDSIYAAAKEFEKYGAKIVELEMKSIEISLSAYYILSSAEASSNLARFDGVRYGYRSENCKNIDELYKNSRSEGFGREVKRRIMLGTFALSSGYYDDYYKKALQVRQLVIEDFQKCFKKCDIILAPATPTSAYKTGKNKSPTEAYLDDMYTVPVNMAGNCAISIPCGTDSNLMPLSLQLIGKCFCENDLYKAAYFYESITKGTKNHDIQGL